MRFFHQMIVGYNNLASNVNKDNKYESPFLYENKDIVEKHSGISNKYYRKTCVSVLQGKEHIQTVNFKITIKNK